MTFPGDIIMDIVSYRESKFFRHNYQAIYLGMLELASIKTYESFEEYACEIEDVLITQLLENNLEYFRYPDSFPIFHVEPEFIPVYIPEDPDVIETPKNTLQIGPFIFGKITSIYPRFHNENHQVLFFQRIILFYKLNILLLII